MDTYPNLKGVVPKGAVEQVKAGSYSADYVNWSRTMQFLRDNAPGWLPELVQTAEGGYVHRGGVGGFLMIRFVHLDGTVTPAFPQAIMDNRNAAIPLDKITARDITDTHRRGLCMAAALAFGLAYELWAKMPLESGYADQSAAPAASPLPPAAGAAETPSITEAQLAEIAEMVPLLAELADTTVEQVSAALTRDNGTVTDLDEAAADALLGKMRRWHKSLADKKAAESSAGTDSPVHEEAAGAAAEPSAGDGKGPVTEANPIPHGQETLMSEESPAESPFAPPTGPRGSKRKQAA